MKNVTITAHPETKQVFTQTLNAEGKPALDKNGKEHGYIRVESRELNLSFGYSNAAKVRSTLIPMTKEAFLKDADLMTNGTKVPGKIIREDSLTPWYEGQKPLQAPKRDAEGNVIEGEFNTITSNGNEVYRNEYFTSNQNAEDVKLEVYDKIEVKEGVKSTILSK